MTFKDLLELDLIAFEEEVEKVEGIARDQRRIEKDLRSINKFTRGFKMSQIQPNEMLEFLIGSTETLNLCKSKRDVVKAPYLSEIDRTLELVNKI